MWQKDITKSLITQAEVDKYREYLVCETDGLTLIASGMLLKRSVIENVCIKYRGVILPESSNTDISLRECILILLYLSCIRGIELTVDKYQDNIRMVFKKITKEQYIQHLKKLGYDDKIIQDCVIEFDACEEPFQGFLKDSENGDKELTRKFYNTKKYIQYIAPGIKMNFKGDKDGGGEDLTFSFNMREFSCDLDVMYPLLMLMLGVDIAKTPENVSPTTTSQIVIETKLTGVSKVRFNLAKILELKGSAYNLRQIKLAMCQMLNSNAYGELYDKFHSITELKLIVKQYLEQLIDTTVKLYTQQNEELIKGRLSGIVNEIRNKTIELQQLYIAKQKKEQELVNLTIHKDTIDKGSLELIEFITNCPYCTRVESTQNRDSLNLTMQVPVKNYNKEDYKVTTRPGSSVMRYLAAATVNSGQIKTILDYVFLESKAVLMIYGTITMLCGDRDALRFNYDTNYHYSVGIPNPHHIKFHCFGGFSSQWMEALDAGRYIEALNIAMMAMQNFNWSDITVMCEFIRMIADVYSTSQKIFYCPDINRYLSCRELYEKIIQEKKEEVKISDEI